ncbi:MAG: hydroxymethylbilane synthase [Dehalococcoidia bacterium]|nr:hydroxymethylbilane synthase [Dehalococcoidia bacterium]
MSTRTFTLGTRGSRLALVQTEEVLRELRRHHPGREFQVKVIKTRGDVDTVTPLLTLGRGVFSSEIERELQDRRIDLAVHSLKDLPGTLPSGLTIAALPERADPRDVLVSRSGAVLAKLASGALVGTSSPRRTALVMEVRPDLCTEPVRGNVDTRVRKVMAGEYDALVLAAAGLLRLGQADVVTEYLDPERFIPAIGQGTLAVEIREDDAELVDLLRSLDHGPTRMATTAERSFLRHVGGGCKAPVAAYATAHGGAVRLRGLVASPDGARVYRRVLEAPVAEAETVGVRLVQALEAAGAKDLLARESAA